MPGRRMGVATARPSASVTQTHEPANVLAVGRFGEEVVWCLREKQPAKHTQPTTRAAKQKSDGTTPSLFADLK